MHIILVSDRMATAKTIIITPRHVVLAVVGFIATVFALSSLFSFVALRHATDIRLPFVQEMLLNLRQQEAQKTQEFLRENLNAMAIKLGQMQAQLIRLDSLGERLAGFVGVKPQEFRMTEPPGRGGMLVEPSRPLSAADLQQQLDLLSKQVDSRGDYMSLLETEMLDERVRRNLLPSTLPVATMWNASGFGWRIDPFTGHQALHEGVDFVGDVGTPIVAAAGGIVVVSELHPQFGNMVEIDHGNDLVTRYAHASKVLVKVGTLVKRGQKIAEIGSTGRSTGPHLHFEVRRNGVALNPNRFLRQAQRDSAPLAARTQ